MTAARFSFDPVKDSLNVAKHGLSLNQGEAVYLAKNKLTLISPSAGETRWMDVAEINRVVLILVYVERNADVRFISLRRASKQERLLHDQWKNNAQTNPT